MDNPYLREAQSLTPALTAAVQITEQVNISKIKNLGFFQLINQQTDLNFPAGKSLKQKINWARRNFSEDISANDYGKIPGKKINEWKKWKKLISAAIIKEIEESVAEISVNPAPAPAPELGVIEVIEPQLIPDISVNPAPAPAPEPGVIAVIEPQLIPDISVNPAPAPAPEPGVIAVIEPQLIPDISVNPAPAPAPEPGVIAVIEPQLIPDISVNPAPAPAPEPGVIEVIEPQLIPDISVNPAPAPAPEPGIIAVIEPQLIPDISVNPAPAPAPEPGIIAVIEPQLIPDISVNPAPPLADIIGADTSVIELNAALEFAFDAQQMETPEQDEAEQAFAANEFSSLSLEGILTEDTDELISAVENAAVQKSTEQAENIYQYGALADIATSDLVENVIFVE
ncbi:hypothetical protein WN093_13990 [Gammaproteobacteria bacterium AS21]